MQHNLPSERHYIRLAVSPPNLDQLTLRKILQDALTQTFGLTSAVLPIDILWSADDGAQFVVRVHQGLVELPPGLGRNIIFWERVLIYWNSDASKVLAAVVAWSDPPRISVLKESPFLPSLLSTDTPL